MTLFGVSLLLICFHYAASQENNNPNTWTCGVFLAGEKNEIPLAKFYEIPPQKATCPAKFKDTWKRGKFSKKCGKMGKEWEMNWFQEGNWEDLWSPFVRTLSRGRFGKEVCTVAKEELGLENIPGLEYPQPLQLGFYYSYCGKDDWKDTGVRSGGMVCCKNGASIPCDVFLAELDGLDGSDEVGGEDKNNIVVKSSSRKSGKQKSVQDPLISQASDSNIQESEAPDGDLNSLKSAGETINNLKAALESDKKLSAAEINTAKKTILGFRSAATVLFKQAEDLQKLL